MPGKKRLRRALDLRELREGVARDFEPLTQTEAAKRAHVTPSMISKIESGVVPVSPQLAFRLAGVYKVHHDEIRAASDLTRKRMQSAPTTAKR